MERSTSTCDGCGGETTWSVVRFDPSGPPDAAWIGRAAVCRSALGDPSHPCRTLPDVAAGTEEAVA